MVFAKFLIRFEFQKDFHCYGYVLTLTINFMEYLHGRLQYSDKYKEDYYLGQNSALEIKGFDARSVLTFVSVNMLFK